jgi:hypothetical protein
LNGFSASRGIDGQGGCWASSRFRIAMRRTKILRDER